MVSRIPLTWEILIIPKPETHIIFVDDSQEKHHSLASIATIYPAPGMAMVFDQGTGSQRSRYHRCGSGGRRYHPIPVDRKLISMGISSDVPGLVN
jgi:hypothetical protein